MDELDARIKQNKIDGERVAEEGIKLQREKEETETPVSRTPESSASNRMSRSLAAWKIASVSQTARERRAWRVRMR